jgi:hypothetical protein
MAWVEAWQMTKYRQPPMMELVGLMAWLHQNPRSFLDYKQKKSIHQEEDESSRLKKSDHCRQHG